MSIPFRRGLEGSHEVDGDFLERIAFVDLHKSMSLCLGVTVPGLADPTSVDEIFHHLLEPREVEVPSDASYGSSNPHVSSFLCVGM